VYHKPVGELVTRSDPEGRLPSFRGCRQAGGVAVVAGYQQLGAAAATDSGELANRLMHPRYEIEREYAVRVQACSTRNTLKTGARHHLDDGLAAFERIAPADERTAPSANRCTGWCSERVANARCGACRGGRARVSRLIRVRYGRSSCRAICAGQWREVPNTVKLQKL